MKRFAVCTGAFRWLVSAGLALTLFVSVPMAQAKSVSGTCGDDMNWSFDGGVLTISGSGEMDGDPDWLDMKRDIKKVVVEEGVESIADNAFEYCKNMEEITLPESLIEVGDRAFYYCESLEEITLPASLEKFGEYVFYGSGLVRATLAEGTTEIFDNQFDCAEELEEVVIPDTVVEVGDRAFYYCESLEEITLPASLEKFGEYVFYGCKRLETINFCGSQDQWNAIKMGSGNSEINDLTINFDCIMRLDGDQIDDDLGETKEHGGAILSGIKR